MEATTTFLNVMEWAANADRTNSAAAALTVHLRNRWLGGKPVVAVTANKSHAGKNTVIEFATGESVKTAISWQGKGWPVERAGVGALNFIDTAVLLLDNARLDKGDTQIASQFVERIATDPEPFLFSTGTGAPVRRKNNFVMAITTNYGSLSEDILNRSLPIRLLSHGDVAARKSDIGNPAHEYLPAMKKQIGAELRGLIVRWVKAGCPIDNNVRHPFSEWAKVVGGILTCNGFTDFLANYGIRRMRNNVIKKGLGLLGASKIDEWHRPAEWAKIAVALGLKRTVIPAADQENEVSQARGIGVVLCAHQKESFQVGTDDKILTLRLQIRRHRMEDDKAHKQYCFVVDREVPLPDDDGGDDATSEENK